MSDTDKLDAPAPSEDVLRVERIARWEREQAEPLTGWDFSQAQNRPILEPLPWDYRAVARPFVDAAQRMLDLGTGGGEILLTLAPLPPFCVATELSEPRAQVARRRLSAHSVRVAVLESTRPLPFRPGAFDLVLIRNSAFIARHIGEVLNREGVFLTQQVARGNLADLLQVLGLKEGNPDWQYPEQAAADLRAAGFTSVEFQTFDSFFEFVSLGAMLWFLEGILPGRVEVSACYEGLLELQRRADRGEKLRFTRKRYLLTARK